MSVIISILDKVSMILIALIGRASELCELKSATASQCPGRRLQVSNGSHHHIGLLVDEIPYLRKFLVGYKLFFVPVLKMGWATSKNRPVQELLLLLFRKNHFIKNNQS